MTFLSDSRHLLALTFAFLLSSMSAWAQITSTLSGQVLDSQGLGLARVELRLVNKEEGVERQAHSDDSGSFSVSGLLPGHYEITAVKAGLALKHSPLM